MAEAGITDLRGFVYHVAAFDPHEGRKPFVKWLITTYAHGDFLLEDLSKAREILSAFRRWQRRLDPEARDLSRHRSLADVSRLILPLEADLVSCHVTNLRRGIVR